MKSILVKFLLIIVIMFLMVAMSGCTLKIETTDNSVSASVDGDTTEKVDNIIVWIKERLRGLFDFEDNAEPAQTAPIGDGQGTIL